MNQNPETTPQKPGDGHLQYLLTAYLFDSISAAGRREVESHLEKCAQCRDALSDLRSTLGEVEEALDDGGREYIFEERRRTRVREAARERTDWITKLSFNWKYGAVAAVLMVIVVGGALFTGMTNMSVKVAYDAKYAPAYSVTELSAQSSSPEVFYDESKVEVGTGAESFGGGKSGAESHFDSNGPAPAIAADDGRMYRLPISESKADSPVAKAPIAQEPSAPPAIFFNDNAENYAETRTRNVRGSAKIEGKKEESIAPSETKSASKHDTLARMPQKPSAPQPPPSVVAKPVSKGKAAGLGVSPSSKEDSDVVVPRDLLDKAELGDRFETINPDRPDTQSAFGNPDAPMRHEIKRLDDVGGGAVAGVALDDVVGVGGGASPGQGGGWGGGTGTGAGGGGTFGNSNGGRKVVVKRYGGHKADEAAAAAPAATPAPAASAPAGAVASSEQSEKKKSLGATTLGRRPAVEEESAGRKDVAIAAKDAEIRKQEEVLALDRADKEKYAELSAALSKQVDKLKEMDADGVLELATKIQPANGLQPADQPVELEYHRYVKISNPQGEVTRQQHAVVVEREKAPRARDEKIAMEDELNVDKNSVSFGINNLNQTDGAAKAPQKPEQSAFLGSFNGDLEKKTSADSSGLRAHVMISNKSADLLYQADGSMKSIPAAEQALRGYLHFSEENASLTLKDFARRPLPVPPPLLTDEGMDEDAFIQRYGTRPFVDAQRDKLSTFAMDVDTSSYTRTRATLNANLLPDPETVRVEEFVNYFKQPYTVAGDDAFGVFAEGGPSLFGAGNELEMLKVGIKSRDPRPDERKPAVLTFVIDSSGSMGKGNRLELVQHALKSLVNSLRPEDAVSIVAFGEQGELVLPRTLARQKQHILDAITTLSPRGGTNVESGLSLGYRMADEAFSADAVNRIILCSDGVANVGAKGPDEILKLVKVFAGRGVDLCTIGFGMGQYNDQMMQRLANEGNGSSYFVDNKAEAERVFSEQLPPNLDVLARDAKVQVEFNPEVIDRYRLLGYEKRKIADKDFRNDKIDAGEVGHSTLVTALYEIKRKPNSHGALGKVFLRWKDAGYRHLPVIERNFPLPEGIIAGSVSQTNANLRFLACVAEFAELLRNSRWARDGSYAAVLQQLRNLPPAIQTKPEWSEVVNLVTQAQKLSMQMWLHERR